MTFYVNFCEYLYNFFYLYFLAVRIPTKLGFFWAFWNIKISVFFFCGGEGCVGRSPKGGQGQQTNMQGGRSLYHAMNVLTYLLQTHLTDSSICLASKRKVQSILSVIVAASGIFASRLILFVLHFTVLI